MVNRPVLSTIALLTLLALTATGCEVVGGIFKAGIWVGALTVIVVLVLIGVVFAKMRR